MFVIGFLHVLQDFSDACETLAFLRLLEPRHLYRTDQKRPDGLTLVPWADGKQLLWDVTVVDSLAPCRINARSVCNPGSAAAEAEEPKN